MTLHKRKKIMSLINIVFDKILAYQIQKKNQITHHDQVGLNLGL